MDEYVVDDSGNTIGAFYGDTFEHTSGRIFSCDGYGLINRIIEQAKKREITICILKDKHSGEYFKFPMRLWSDTTASFVPNPKMNLRIDQRILGRKRIIKESFKQ